MQPGSAQPTQGARQRTVTRAHSLHSHFTGLLGFALAVLFVCVVGAYVYAGNSPAKPYIGAIRSGDVQVTKSEGTLRIQASDGSIIDYSNFDIPQDFEVQFNQASASARVLNRDRSGNRSIINGTLNADGQVYLVNPAGFAIGASASINVGRFVAAAGGHISDESFLPDQDRFTNFYGKVINKNQPVMDPKDPVQENESNTRWSTDLTKIHMKEVDWVHLIPVLDNCTVYVLARFLTGGGEPRAQEVLGDGREAVIKQFGRGLEVLDDLELLTHMGSIFLANAFDKQLDEYGIEQTYTPCECPTANGLAG